MMERVKWTDKITNAVVQERVGEGKNNAETHEEEKKLAGPLAKKELKDVLEGMVTGKNVQGRRKYFSLAMQNKDCKVSKKLL